jgi:hypothetical protein
LPVEPISAQGNDVGGAATQLYQFAKERHALIVEDDYDGEFRTAGEP